MPNKGNRRGTSDLIALLDEPATWVVRGKSGILGNARSLRPALELAARNANAATPIDCIISATRFDDAPHDPAVTDGRESKCAVSIGR